MTTLENRTTVGIEADRVTNVTSTDFPGHWPGANDAWDVEKFQQQLSINVHALSDQHSNFDLVGIDTSLANAFRRIMIADIPTIAVEEVYIHANTSIIQDEVLAHRLGLVPLVINPERVHALPRGLDASEIEDYYDDSNTFVLRLNVTCERLPNGDMQNAHVYARDITFDPMGVQSEWVADEGLENVFRVANPDILIAKLRPNQSINLTMFCHLGFGHDHAKFSPVATASYRLMPTITITGDIDGADARKFVKCFPPGVVELEDGKPVVKDARKDTVSREVLRHEEFNGKVKLGRKRDHFIFNIESSGALEPDEIFMKSVMELQAKAQTLKSALSAYLE